MYSEVGIVSCVGRCVVSASVVSSIGCTSMCCSLVVTILCCAVKNCVGPSGVVVGAVGAVDLCL